MQLKYKRVLIKVSGEAMAGEQHFGLDFDTVLKICESIKECVSLGAEVAVVVGGGNFWRGRTSGKMDRTRADHMGMLATVINALALGDALEQLGVDVRVQTAISMQQVAEPYIRNKAVRHLEKGRVVVFGCGTGNPFFSTDTAAALRAAEIGADAILMAKNIDYIYTADPKKDPTATPLYDVTYDEIIEKDLRAFDMSAVIFCRDNRIESYGFGLADPENIYRAVMGEPVGTRMHN